MVDFFRNIPQTIKGIAIMLFGVILLMYGCGILRARLDLLIIIAGISMIIYGFVVLNGPKKLSRIIEDISKKN